MLKVYRRNDLSIRVGYTKRYGKRERGRESKKKGKIRIDYIWSSDEWVCVGYILAYHIWMAYIRYKVISRSLWWKLAWERDPETRWFTRPITRWKMWKTVVHQREEQWTKLLGPRGRNPCFPFRHFNNSGSNIPNPLHRGERRKEHRNRTYSDSSPGNNQQRISDVSYRPPLPPPVIISFKYFNLSEFDIPIIRNLSTFFESVENDATMENER